MPMTLQVGNPETCVGLRATREPRHVIHFNEPIRSTPRDPSAMYEYSYYSYRMPNIHYAEANVVVVPRNDNATSVVIIQLITRLVT